MRGQIGTSLAALAIAIPANLPCWADETGSPQPSFEVYTGADYSGRSGDINSSVVWGVFSPVTQPGFRLKLDGITNLAGKAPLFSAGFAPDELKTVSDLMAGYQFKYSSVWIRLYAGAAYGVELHNFGINGIVQPQAFGAAAAFQTYWTVNDRLWASLNAAWLQPDASTALYLRSAYEVYRTGGGLGISAGAEASLSLAGDGSPFSRPTYHNDEHIAHYERYGRGGALLNLRYGANDLTLSGGMSQSYGYAGSGAYASTSPYASISYGRQF